MGGRSSTGGNSAIKMITKGSLGEGRATKTSQQYKVPGFTIDRLRIKDNGPLADTTIVTNNKTKEKTTFRNLQSAIESINSDNLRNRAQKRKGE